MTANVNNHTLFLEYCRTAKEQFRSGNREAAKATAVFAKNIMNIEDADELLKFSRIALMLGPFKFPKELEAAEKIAEYTFDSAILTKRLALLSKRYAQYNPSSITAGMYLGRARANCKHIKDLHKKIEVQFKIIKAGMLFHNKNECFSDAEHLKETITCYIADPKKIEYSFKLAALISPIFPFYTRFYVLEPLQEIVERSGDEAIIAKFKELKPSL